MESLYQEYILDLYKHPLNKTKLENFDVHHKEHNPTCGDTVEVFIKYNRDSIEDIGWQGDGCAISQAATSLLTEHIKGKTCEAIKKISNDEMLALLGLKDLNPTRLRCATLALEAIKKTI